MGLVLWLAAILLIAMPSAPGAAETPPIAQVKKVTGQVVILRSDRRLPVKVGDPLFEKDIIETGPDGGIGITFVDNTVFSTGPNSQLALDEFQFEFEQFPRFDAGRYAARDARRRFRRHHPQLTRGDEDQDPDRAAGRARHDLRGSGLRRPLTMRRPIIALACTMLARGVPRQALFVVLPNAEEGGAGAITVDDGKTVTTLDQPYAAAESRAGSSEPVEESRGNIGVIFRRAIAAQPILPHHFRLYFVLGSDQLTAGIGRRLSRSVRRHRAAPGLSGRSDRPYRYSWRSCAPIRRCH